MSEKMDVDMKFVEIEFAQRLASGEPTIRKRALNLLREYVKEESEKGLILGCYFFCRKNNFKCRKKYFFCPTNFWTTSLPQFKKYFFRF
jgi:lipopolysaccharide biosynthesis regulator YciM